MSTLHPPVGPKDHAQGPQDAPATLVEYGDYQCPYCAQAFPELQQIQQYFGDSLRFVFRNFPIPELHPQAVAAAITAEYCGTVGKFWPAHDALYEHQDELGEALYEQIATQVGADPAGLRKALHAEGYAQQIQDSVDSGLRSGVNGTPSFFLNGQKFEISRSMNELVDAIERVVGAQG